MIIKYFYWLMFLLCLALNSCLSASNNDAQKMIGSKIVLGKFILSDSCSTQKNIKLLTYYSNSSCSPCLNKEFIMWSGYIKELRSIDSTVSVMLIIGPQNELNEVSWTLDYYDLKDYVVYDRDGEFEALNNLPESELFHTFLLDQDNTVLLVGSPIGNDKMWSLYTSLVNERRGVIDL